jgi:hypothetical protein
MYRHRRPWRLCFGRYQVPSLLSSHPVELVDHSTNSGEPASLLRMNKSLQSTKKITNLLDGTSRDWYGLRVVCVGIFVESNWALTSPPNNPSQNIDPSASRSQICLIAKRGFAFPRSIKPAVQK